MKFFSQLRREQKEAVGLLSIGTFLEYFDLILYVHMSVFLNELFFPQSDPHTTELLSALGFCSTFVLRPFGALLFGWIGDNISRKTTVIITTAMMSLSCLIMYTLPTYAQIGISASWLMTLCRMMQGMSSMGEIIGAELYLTETIERPLVFPVVGFLTISLGFGAMAALAVASLVTNSGFNWRNAFLIGATIAFVGAIARTRLRETPDFADAKRRLQNAITDTLENDQINQDKAVKRTNILFNDKVDWKTSLSYFFLESPAPISFYLIYVFCGNILKDKFGYSAAEVIHHNLIILLPELLGHIITILLSYKIYPLKILKAKLIIYFPFVLILPYLLNNTHNAFIVTAIQLYIAIFSAIVLTASPIFYKNFPVFKRFTYTSFMYALSRASMYVLTSFGLVYLTKYFGYYGLFVILVPVMIGYTFGLLHFEKLEKEAGNYPK